jgi:hypothetical protein
MTRKERLQRVNILKQQLTLIQLLAYEFEEKLGKQGVKDRIDEILDELSYHLKILNAENQ